MSILSHITEIFRPAKHNRKEIGFNSDSLDIDKLSNLYSLSRERVGQLLEAELGWPYQSSVILNPLDLRLEVVEIDKLTEFSAIILTNGKSKRRFITSNPDLILASAKEFEKYTKASFAFEIAGREAIDICFKRFLHTKMLLSEIGSDSRSAFGIFILSFLDCLEIGAIEINYENGKYFALSSTEKYEGELSLEIIEKSRAQLVEKGASLLHDFVFNLGYADRIKVELKSDGFKLRIGESKIVNLPQEERELRHILLVDDDQRFVDLLKRGIRLKGFKVSVASSAKQAVEYLNTNGVIIDLVISDFHIPNYSGASLISSIRNVDSNLPIIALTGDSQAHSHISLINAGANAIVRKSDDPKVLFAWIYKFLNDEYRLKVA